MIIFISGAGGSGKDSVCERVLKDFPEIHKVVQYTTRPMRSGEVNGVNYHFIDFETYFEMKNSGMFLETRSYVTNQGLWEYATSKECLKDGIYLLWGPDKLYSSIKENCNDSIKGILLKVNPRERLNRMLSRCSKDSDVVESCRRICSDEKDFKSCDESKYDFILDNSNISLEESVGIIEEYIRSIVSI